MNIIDGIPNQQLQNQVRMQNFSSMSELMQFFKNITLSDADASDAAPSMK